MAKMVYLLMQTNKNGYTTVLGVYETRERAESVGFQQITSDKKWGNEAATYYVEQFMVH